MFAAMHKVRKPLADSIIEIK